MREWTRHESSGDPRRVPRRPARRTGRVRRIEPQERSGARAREGCGRAGRSIPARCERRPRRGAAAHGAAARRRGGRARRARGL